MMTKRVFIGVGHGGKDPGALKYIKEADANLQMALGLKAELERHGVTVGISRLKDEDDPLIEEIREANSFAPDVAVECHIRRRWRRWLRSLPPDQRLCDKVHQAGAVH